MNQDFADNRVTGDAVNPYATTRELAEDEGGLGIHEVSVLSVAKTLGLWTVVCTLSAAPSFFFAITNMAKDQTAAMVIGVIIFIGIYSIGDLVSRNLPARKNPRIRSILRATFIVRSIMVVIFPLAIFTDLLLGMISVSIVSRIVDPLNGEFPERMRFEVTLATTLVQGCLLSVFLFLLGLLIAAFVFIFRSIANIFSSKAYE